MLSVKASSSRIVNYYLSSLFSVLRTYPFEFLFLMCAFLCLYFLFFSHCSLGYLLRAHFLILLSARAYSVVLYSDVGRKLSINGYNFIFLACTNVCSVTVLT